MICTPTERDLIVAGATRLVVAGNPVHVWLADHYLAPQRWVEATGPCRTCDGGSVTFPLSQLTVKCPNCIDGRKREALQVWCCDGSGFLSTDGIIRACEHDTERMLVTFAYATVEVLPVYDFDDWSITCTPVPVVALDSYGGLILADKEESEGARGFPIELDPQPVPGRDWVVLLDNVELT